MIEPFPGKMPYNIIEEELQLLARSMTLTSKIETFEFINAMPVDTRHNVKINREALVLWVTKERARS